MKRIENIFIDDGGVMNDNSLRGPQWQRLVGEYLEPKLGGSRAAWAEANKTVVEREMARFGEVPSGKSYLDFWREEELRWIREMCDLVEVDAPGTDEDCSRLSRATNSYVIAGVESAIPGAVDAIRSLHGMGYTLYTASGEYSLDLQGYLAAMGVRQLFERIYGPDLINTWKGGRQYYDRIFGDARVEPSECLVIDDSPKAVQGARDAGATAVLVSAEPPPATSADAVLKSLAELPALLADRRST